ncbi:MAG TPA: GNAT family N-acetyltransferase [Trueperaceae bacterium]
MAQALRVVEHLARHEAENNLPVGVASALADGSLRNDDTELLLALDAGGRSAAALVMTPPYRLLIAYGDDLAAREALLTDMLARGVHPPGVVGPEPAAREVATWWAERLSKSVVPKMRQGVYRLSRVRESDRTPGAVRPATVTDADVIVPWLEAFFAEAHVDVGTPVDTFRAFVTSDYRRLYVFEVDGEPVSIAGLGARTPHGRRIGPVYTPPAHRRRGYAESLVARVTTDALAASNRFCFLFTDLDNPTSNAVYERIGYEKVIESAEYDLLPTG